jgi:hypothetical protein
LILDLRNFGCQNHYGNLSKLKLGQFKYNSSCHDLVNIFTDVSLMADAHGIIENDLLKSLKGQSKYREP